MTPEDRFWPKVKKTDTCWLWLGAHNAEGYGRFHLNGKLELAYRVSYMWAFGPLPEGLYLDHACHTPECVRPEHLRLLSNKENAENLRGAKKNSKSGIRGVYWSKHKSKWEAQVTHHGKQYTVGRFDSIEEAEKAVVAKRNELFTYNDKDRK